MFLPPGNRCFSTIGSSGTNPNGARVARRSGFRILDPAEAASAVRREPRRVPFVRSAAKKPRFHSGRLRDDLCFAGTASSRGDRPCRRKSQSGSCKSGTRNHFVGEFLGLRRLGRRAAKNYLLFCLGIRTSITPPTVVPGTQSMLEPDEYRTDTGLILNVD